jgi:hypothetical protein
MFRLITLKHYCGIVQKLAKQQKMFALCQQNDVFFKHCHCENLHVRNKNQTCASIADAGESTWCTHALWCSVQTSDLVNAQFLHRAHSLCYSLRAPAIKLYCTRRRTSWSTLSCSLSLLNYGICMHTAADLLCKLFSVQTFRCN